MREATKYQVAKVLFYVALACLRREYAAQLQLGKKTASIQ